MRLRSCSSSRPSTRGSGFRRWATGRSRLAWECGSPGSPGLRCSSGSSRIDSASASTRRGTSCSWRRSAGCRSLRWRCASCGRRPAHSWRHWPPGATRRIRLPKSARRSGPIRRTVRRAVLSSRARRRRTGARRARRRRRRSLAKRQIADRGAGPELALASGREHERVRGRGAGDHVRLLPGERLEQDAVSVDPEARA